MLDGPPLDQLGELAVALGRYLEAAQGVVFVGVEAGRHQQQLWTKRREGRANFLFPGTEKNRIAAATSERNIEDVAMRPAFAGTPGPRIERELMGRRVEGLGVVLETVLRAVAMVNVEVEYPDAANALGASRDEADSHIVDEAEDHGLVVLGMMTGRPHDRERVFHRSVEPPVYALHHGARRAAGSEHR